MRVIAPLLIVAVAIALPFGLCVLAANGGGVALDAVAILSALAVLAGLSVLMIRLLRDPDGS